MSEEQDEEERPCLHCMIIELFDEFFTEYPAGTGQTDAIDSDEVVTALAADSGDGGQAFHLKADSESGRSRTAIR
ncbi:MAG: hypothetical protein WB760_28970 [Xanthobacteraceae bacterium]